MSSKINLINQNAALFIDRDGVINQLRMDDYVKEIKEFILLPEVIPALKILRPLFKRIFIVTNQQGIGKGLMKDSIDNIHHFFLTQLPLNLQPDQIYYCPHLASENCVCRKPKPGMALMAKLDFPEINLSKSIMIGDSKSDMEFALNSGMLPAFISQKKEDKFQTFDNLYSFALSLVHK